MYFFFLLLVFLTYFAHSEFCLKFDQKSLRFFFLFFFPFKYFYGQREIPPGLQTSHQQHLYITISRIWSWRKRVSEWASEWKRKREKKGENERDIYSQKKAVNDSHTKSPRHRKIHLRPTIHSYTRELWLYTHLCGECVICWSKRIQQSCCCCWMFECDILRIDLQRTTTIHRWISICANIFQYIYHEFYDFNSIDEYI